MISTPVLVTFVNFLHLGFILTNICPYIRVTGAPVGEGRGEVWAVHCSLAGRCDESWHQGQVTHRTQPQSALSSSAKPYSLMLHPAPHVHCHIDDVITSADCNWLHTNANVHIQSWIICFRPGPIITANVTNSFQRFVAQLLTVAKTIK